MSPFPSLSPVKRINISEDKKLNKQATSKEKLVLVLQLFFTRERKRRTEDGCFLLPAKRQELISLLGSFVIYWEEMVSCRCNIVLLLSTLLKCG